MTKATATLDRFWAKVDRRSDDECWPWMTGRNANGYGCFNGAGEQYAHRYSFTTFIRPLAPGEHVDHLCHNPACVNPAHLRAVTHAQNLQNRKGATAHSKSGVRGVYFEPSRNKWLAQVSLNRKIVWTKRFATLAEAEAAVIEARMVYHTHNAVDRRELSSR